MMSGGGGGGGGGESNASMTVGLSELEEMMDAEKSMRASRRRVSKLRVSPIMSRRESGSSSGSVSPVVTTKGGDVFVAVAAQEAAAAAVAEEKQQEEAKTKTLSLPPRSNKVQTTTATAAESLMQRKMSRRGSDVKKLRPSLNDKMAMFVKVRMRLRAGLTEDSEKKKLELDAAALVERVAHASVREQLSRGGMENYSSAELAVMAAKLNWRLTKERDDVHPPFIFMPDSGFVKWWNAALAIVTAICVALIPLHAAFSSDNDATVGEYVASCLWIVDTAFVKPRTAFQDRHGEVVVHIEALRNRYKHGLLVPDVVSELMLVAFIVFTHVMPGAAHAAAWCRIFRMGCLLRYQRLVYYIDRQFALDSKFANHLRMMRVVMNLFFCTHVLGCVLWAIASAEQSPNGWAHRQDMIGLEIRDRGTLFLYIACVEAVMEMLVGGSIAPRTEGERIFAFVCLLVGCAFQSILFGQVARLVSIMNRSASEYKDMLDVANENMRILNLPVPLRNRVNHYYKYMWTRSQCTDLDAFRMRLSQALGSEVALHQYKLLLAKVPLFREADSMFLLSLVNRLKTSVFLPGDYVIRHGELGHEMFFITHGECAVLAPNATTGEAEVVHVFRSGSFFGEIALIRDLRRTATIRANGYCELTMLTREAFELVARNHPEAATDVVAKLDRNMENVAKETTKRAAEENKMSSVSSRARGRGAESTATTESKMRRISQLQQHVKASGRRDTGAAATGTVQSEGGAAVANDDGGGPNGAAKAPPSNVRLVRRRGSLFSPRISQDELDSGMEASANAAAPANSMPRLQQSGASSGSDADADPADLMIPEDERGNPSARQDSRRGGTGDLSARVDALSAKIDDLAAGDNFGKILAALEELTAHQKRV